MEFLRFPRVANDPNRSILHASVCRATSSSRVACICVSTLPFYLNHINRIAIRMQYVPRCVFKFQSSHKFKWNFGKCDFFVGGSNRACVFFRDAFYTLATFIVRHTSWRHTKYSITPDDFFSANILLPLTGHGF